MNPSNPHFDRERDATKKVVQPDKDRKAAALKMPSERLQLSVSRKCKLNFGKVLLLTFHEHFICQKRYKKLHVYFHIQQWLDSVMVTIRQGAFS